MNDNYATPAHIKRVFDGWFDPCPLNSPSGDGLKVPWGERTFVNPPYSNPAPWVTKAIEESRQGKTIVMLLRVDTSTKWFAALVAADAEVLWFSRRLHFSKGPANFASMLVILK